MKKQIKCTSYTGVYYTCVICKPFIKMAKVLMKIFHVDMVHSFAIPFRQQLYRAATVSRLTEDSKYYKPLHEWKNYGRISLSSCGWSLRFFTETIIVAHELDRSIMDENHVFVDNDGTVTLMKHARVYSAINKVEEIDSPRITLCM